MTEVIAKQGRPADKALQAKRKARILKAASKLFAKHGYAGTDLNEVARSVKLSKGALYYYFNNKECLFLATVDWMMAELLAALNTVLDSELESLAIIEQGIEAYLGFCAKHPEFVELLIHERAAFPERENPTYFVYKEANSEPWHNLYSELMEQGVIRNMPIERIMNVVCDLLYGVIFTNHFSGRKISHKRQTADIVDILFNGILTAKGQKLYKGAAAC